MHFQAKIKINEWIEEGEVLQVVAEIHLDKDRDAKHLMGPVGLFYYYLILCSMKMGSS